MNLPLEDDTDKELLESCKKEYVASCTSSIATAVSSKDRAAAERILQSYKKLMGEDTNYLLYHTLIKGIPTESQTTTPSKEKGSYYTSIKQISLGYIKKIHGRIQPVGQVFLGHIKKIRGWILRNKKWIAIVAASAIVLLITVLVVSAIQESHNKEIARQEAIKNAIEKARKDSILAVERARIAAIEEACRDSIAAVERRERAIRDSIDYAEHAGFVSKYAKIGLIITNIKMSRGKNENGVPTKGIDFTVFNPTHKTIKYVIANFHGVNKFNDRVSNDVRCRGIGPVDPHEYGSWDFNDAIPDKNDVIDDLKIYFQVVYTNGSSKNIQWDDAYVKDFKTSWFEGR